MTSILALAALGSWTYAGFLASPPPVPPTPTPAPAPTRPIDVRPAPGPEIKPGPEPDRKPEPEPTKPPEAPAASTSTPPTRYRLADASGQVWEHADPAYLRSFVQARNRSIVQPTYPQPLRTRPSRCVNGRCD